VAFSELTTFSFSFFCLMLSLIFLAFSLFDFLYLFNSTIIHLSFMPNKTRSFFNLLIRVLLCLWITWLICRDFVQDQKVLYFASLRNVFVTIMEFGFKVPRSNVLSARTISILSIAWRTVPSLFNFYLSERVIYSDMLYISMSVELAVGHYGFISLLS